MDKIFGEVDAVEVGEQEGTDKMEAMVISQLEHQENARNEGLELNSRE
jgi:hypothetical protein